MIIIKNVGMYIMRIHRAAHALISWAEITIFYIVRGKGILSLNDGSNPRTILTMGGYNNPLFTQWMPAFLPYAAGRQTFSHDNSSRSFSSYMRTHSIPAQIERCQCANGQDKCVDQTKACGFCLALTRSELRDPGYAEKNR